MKNSKDFIIERLKKNGFSIWFDEPNIYFRTSNGKGISIKADGCILYGGKPISEDVLMLKMRRKEFIPYSDKVYDCNTSGGRNSTLFAECCGSANSKDATVCFGCGSRIRTY